MKCFFHSADLDGHCSGALVKRVYPECKLIGINYGDEFPWNAIAEDDIVFMVDFSLQPFEKMITLNKHCGSLVWIDHHISAFKEEVEHGVDIDGLRRDGIGACQLVWEFFHGSPVPAFVRLLAEYDVWNHEDPNTLPFQYGMRMKNTDPENQVFWESLFSTNERLKIIEQGALILEYEEKQNEIFAKSCAFETEFDGLKCIAVNKLLTNSKVFNSVWDENLHDVMLTFGWRKGKWTVSLYSPKKEVDVSVIAKARGGGGHTGAAGFQCKELPFKLR